MKLPFSWIFNCYWRNRGFKALGLTVFVSGIITKVAYHWRLFVFAEDLFTLLFIFTLWLAFHFGILIKHQFANCRSSVVPGYRRAHIIAILLIYFIFIVLGVLWAHGMRLDFPWMSRMSMSGVWGTALLVSLFVILLGYLSIGRCLLYGYCFLVLSSIFFVQIMDIYKMNDLFARLPLALWGLGSGLFIWRLLTIHEESFEYGHILTWPPREFSGYIGGKEKKTVPQGRGAEGNVSRYPYADGIFKRVLHWDLALGTEVQFIWSILWVIVGIYVLVIFDVPWIVNWLKNINGNFLLLIATPLVIGAIRNYKSLIFWGYDILRPISRQRYLTDQIAGALLRFFEYWSLIVIVLGVIPALLFYPPQFVSWDLLGFFLLSGSILFLIISVLVYITATEDNLAIIVNFGLLAYVALLFFEPAVFLDLRGYILTCLVCLAGGLIYIFRGYHAWCRKEYV